MIQDIRLFTSQPRAAFYDTLFLHLDLSELEQQKKKVGRTGYPAVAMFCAFMVMKCEGFGYITDLVDYLDNNRLIAYYCGFDITKPLPSYWTFDRFCKSWIMSWSRKLCRAKYCPCNHKCFHKGSKATGCTKYVTLPDDYRLSIQRDSIAFKSIYALRTECERYNSRFKATS